MATRADIDSVLDVLKNIVPRFLEDGATMDQLAPVVALLGAVDSLPVDASPPEVAAVYAQTTDVVVYLTETLRPLLQAKAGAAAPPPQEPASAGSVAASASFNALQGAASALVALAVRLNEDNDSGQTLFREMTNLQDHHLRALIGRGTLWATGSDAYEKGRALYLQRDNLPGAKQAWRHALEKWAAALAKKAQSEKLGVLSIPLPADLTNVPSAELPTGVKAPPLTSGQKAEDVPHPPVSPPLGPSLPPAPIVAVAPTETEIVKYLEGADFDIAEAVRMLQEVYPDYADVAAIQCAMKRALREYPLAHRERYAFRWTTAPPSADLTGSGRNQTLEIGNASPGPGGQVWRHIAIPVAQEGAQVTAYSAVGGLTLAETEYARKLKESMQPSASEVPVMEGTLSPQEVAYDRFYIEEDGTIYLSSSAYLRLSDAGVEQVMNEETFEDAFVGEWGSVTVTPINDRWQLVGDAQDVANFLVFLDTLAKSLGAVSVGQAAVATAEQEEEDDDAWGWGGEDDGEDDDDDPVTPAPVAPPQVSAPISVVNVIEAQVEPAHDAYAHFLRSILRLEDDVQIISAGYQPGGPETYTIRFLGMPHKGALQVETVRLNGEATFKGTFTEQTGDVWTFRISGQTATTNFGKPEVILRDLEKAIAASAYHMDADKEESLIAGAKAGAEAQNTELLFRDLERRALEIIKEQSAPQYWLTLGESS